MYFFPPTSNVHHYIVTMPSGSSVNDVSMRKLFFPNPYLIAVDPGQERLATLL